VTDAVHHPFPEPPAEGEATPVAEGILWMRLPLPMALDHVNVYALDEGDGWTLVDTGFSSRRSKAVWEALLAGPLAGRPVRRLIVTHHHPDHIGLAGWFQARGAELLTTRTAWLYARMLCLDVQSLPSAEMMTFYRRLGLDEAALARRAAERPFNFSDVVEPLPLGFTRIVEGSEIVAGGRRWQVRMGNGHAPEHATLWTDGLVLGGDQLLPGISANIGVYPSEPEADPLADWLQSCRDFLPFAHGDQLILPGHKLPFTGLPFRLGQMVENHLSALDRLTDHLSSARRAAECFLPLFRREVTGPEEGMALVEALAHLNHLRASGRATRVLDEDGAWLWQSV